MRSSAECKLEEFLVQNNIKYYYNFYFREFKTTNKRKRNMPFDFYLPDYKMVIELDGKQHYTLKFNGRTLKYRRENDFLKTAFCKKRGFLLLRIKYDRFDKIEEEMCKFFDKHFPI